VLNELSITLKKVITSPGKRKREEEKDRAKFKIAK